MAPRATPIPVVRPHAHPQSWYRHLERRIHNLLEGPHCTSAPATHCAAGAMAALRDHFGASASMRRGPRRRPRQHTEGGAGASDDHPSAVASASAKAIDLPVSTRAAHLQPLPDARSPPRSHAEADRPSPSTDGSVDPQLSPIALSANTAITPPAIAPRVAVLRRRSARLALRQRYARVERLPRSSPALRKWGAKHRAERSHCWAL